MSDRLFVLIGKHSSPKKFRKYLMKMGTQGRLLELKARQIDPEEGTKPVKFKFRPHYLRNMELPTWSVDGRPFRLESRRYLLIEVRDNSVEFTLRSPEAPAP